MESSSSMAKDLSAKLNPPLQFAFENHRDITAKSEASVLDLLHAQLEKANSENNFELQSKIILDISDYYLKRKEYSEAAKMLNGAKAICLKQHRPLESNQGFAKEISRKLALVELYFLKEYIGLEYPPRDFSLADIYKEKLLQLRTKTKVKLQNYSDSIPLEHPTISNEIQELIKWIQSEINSFLTEMFQHCIKLMQTEPPCEYAILSMGSLARGEMTPYSDLECCILISSDSAECRHYFLKVAKLFELLIINLGETDLVKGNSLLPLTMFNPIPKGLSLDVHKNPAAANGTLIGTVADFAKYQMNEHYVNESSNHLSSSLRTVAYICGSTNGKTLLQSYLFQVKQILDATDPASGKSLRLVRTLKMIEEDLNRFEPNMNSNAEGQLFDVKSDFYRLPQIFLDAIFMHLNLDIANSSDRIQALGQQAIFKTKPIQNLLWLNGIANLWRLKTYSYYGEQREQVDILLRIENNKMHLENEQHRTLKDDDLLTLKTAYKVLLDLHKVFSDFYKANADQQVFSTTNLYDTTPSSEALIEAHLCQYSKAISLNEAICKEAIQADNVPEQIRCYNQLVWLYYKTGNYPDSLSCAKKALLLEEQKNQKGTFELSNCHHNVGMIYLFTGDYAECEKYLRASIQISIEGGRGHDSELSNTWNILGTCLANQGKLKEAIELLKKAMNSCPANSPELLCNYEHLATFYIGIGKHEQSLTYAQKSLSLSNKIFSTTHPVSVRRQCNLAVISYLCGKIQNPLPCYKNAIKVLSNQYNENHPEIIPIMNNIGEYYKLTGKYLKAIKWYKKALDLNIQLLGPNHEFTIKLYINLATIYLILSEYPEASAFYNKVLTSFNQMGVKSHVHIAWALRGFAFIQFNVTTFPDTKAEAEIEQKFLNALNIFQNFYSPNNIEIAKTLIMLTDLKLKNNALDAALDYFGKAQSIYLNIRDENHPDMLSFQLIFAETLRVIGQGLESANLIEELIIKLKKQYGEDGFLVALGHYNLGITLLEMHYNQNSEQNDYLLRAFNTFESAVNIFTRTTTDIPNLYLAQTYDRLADICQEQNDLAQTLKYLENARKIYAIIFKTEIHLTIAESLVETGKTFFKMKELDNAINVFQQVLDIYEKLKIPKDSRVSEIYDYLAKIFYSKEPPESEMFNYYNHQSYNINLSINPKPLSAIATNLIRFAHYAIDNRDLDAALDFYSRALEIKEKLYQEPNTEVLELVLLIARLYAKIVPAQTSLAIDFYKRALDIFKSLGLINHESRVDCLKELANIYFDLNQTQDALDCLTEALPIVELSNDDEKIESLLLQIAQLTSILDDTDNLANKKLKSK